MERLPRHQALFNGILLTYDGQKGNATIVQIAIFVIIGGEGYSVWFMRGQQQVTGVLLVDN